MSILLVGILGGDLGLRSRKQLENGWIRGVLLGWPVAGGVVWVGTFLKKERHYFDMAVFYRLDEGSSTSMVFYFDVDNSGVGEQIVEVSETTLGSSFPERRDHCRRRGWAMAGWRRQQGGKQRWRR